LYSKRPIPEVEDEKKTPMPEVVLNKRRPISEVVDEKKRPMTEAGIYIFVFILKLWYGYLFIHPQLLVWVSFNSSTTSA
jgi:hypothetical protein